MSSIKKTVRRSIAINNNSARPQRRQSQLIGVPNTPAKKPSSSTTAVKPKGKTAESENHVMKKWQMKTLLLTYLTAKLMAINAKQRTKATKRVLENKEKLDTFLEILHEKKRQCHLAEKEREVNGTLDLQIAALTPLAQVALQFTNYYSSLAKELFITLNELRVKKIYINGNRIEFLAEAEASLKKSEDLLVDFKMVERRENQTSLAYLKYIKITTKMTNEELASTCPALLKLCRQASCHLINVLQAKEEQRLGDSRIRELFCTKK